MLSWWSRITVWNLLILNLKIPLSMPTLYSAHLPIPINLHPQQPYPKNISTRTPNLFIATASTQQPIAAELPALICPRARERGREISFLRNQKETNWTTNTTQLRSLSMGNARMRIRRLRQMVLWSITWQWLDCWWNLSIVRTRRIRRWVR